MIWRSLFIRPLLVSYPQIDGGEVYMLRVGDSFKHWIDCPVIGTFFTKTNVGTVFSLFM